VSACRLEELGLVTALGSSARDNLIRLVGGDQTRFGVTRDHVSGRERPFGAVREPLPEVRAELARYDCRNNRLALAALGQIREAVDAAKRQFGPRRVGLVVGSSTSGVQAAEQAFAARQAPRRAQRAEGERSPLGALPESFDLVQLEFGGVAEFLRAELGLEGACLGLSTACSTGAKALLSARRLLELDVCDAVLAGAVDSQCRLTANGFEELQAVAPTLTNPMSRNRAGLTLGEGAALFLLTREAGGVQLLGGGESSDAHHISAPEPSGRGAVRCLRAALADARLEPRDIDYVNLHGTGTLQNDAMESRAIESVFGVDTPCSSTKPLVGHLLGASGAVEAAFCWLLASAAPEGHALLLPPHRYDGERDPALAPIRLVGDDERAVYRGSPRLCTTSFGFAGSNCALVLGADA
jgi:3-oxoacyl-[acyl-carrier-protein] synthase I